MEKKTILLVEDDEPVRQAIQDALERDYRVLEASTYFEAVNHLQDPIALAIVDYSLPDCTGFDVVKALKERKPDLPAILITAHSTEDLAIQALKAGLVDYVQKPLRLAYLTCRISEILDGKPCEKYSRYAGSREEFLVDFVSAYIETHHMEERLLDELARRVYMKKYKFSRLFKERFGMSYTSYLNGVRTENAAHLIRNFDLGISEIAYHVGYRCSTYFGRVFRKRYGVSPLEYRRRIKETRSKSAGM